MVFPYVSPRKLSTRYFIIELEFVFKDVANNSGSRRAYEIREFDSLAANKLIPSKP